MGHKISFSSDQYAIENARNFAIAAHSDQKYGDEPYVAHLDAVAEIVRSYGTNAVILAYLHDILEDTSVYFDKLCSIYGGFTARCVSFMSKPLRGSRAQKNKSMNERVARLKSSDRALYALVFIVKPADRLANVRASAEGSHKGWMKQYRREHSEFKNAFYIPGLCEEIWYELDRLFDQSMPKK